jgi:TldD protein
MSIPMKQLLKSLVDKQSGYVELRWHKRISNQFLATKSRVDVANHGVTEGVRALVDGAWGFAATADVSEPAIRRTIEKAQANARLLAKVRGPRQTHLGTGRLSTEDFVGEGFRELSNLSIANKLGTVVSMEKQLAKSSQAMHTARVRYTEYLEEKAIVTSDGAACSLQISQPMVVESTHVSEFRSYFLSDYFLINPVTRSAP